MAILNVTPDSFYAPSRADRDSLDGRVEQLIDEGADVIDVGGFSTRPGASEVDVLQETARVVMGVEAVRRHDAAMPVSIDTFRAAVAEAVLSRFDGVTVNDISAGEDDPEMIAVVARYGAPFVAMHKRGTPQTMQRMTHYDNVVEEVRGYLVRRAEQLHGAGIRRVILDPGFGFAKTVDQNFELLSGLDRITSIGLPVLVGISRKSFICKILNISPEEALAPTQVLHWECLQRGASILRTHDTRATRQTIALFEKSLHYE